MAYRASVFWTTDDGISLADEFWEFLEIFHDAFYYPEVTNGEEWKPIFKKALLGEGEPGVIFSLLWALAAQPYHFTVHNITGEISDAWIEED